MSDPPCLITIGELARRTGLASSALRYYERAGLLSPTARAGGRRYYGASSAERVAVIQLCQDAGFTLREIRALLTAWRRRSRLWAPLAKAKLRELDTRIAQARRARTLIQHALACPHRHLVRCSNFRATVKAYLFSRERPGHAADEKPLARARSGGQALPGRVAGETLAGPRPLAQRQATNPARELRRWSRGYEGHARLSGETCR